MYVLVKTFIKGDVVKSKCVAFLVGLTFICGVAAQAQEWGTVGTGYLYQLTENNTFNWTSYHGWYVLPTFNITKQVGVFADFANLYGKGQNLHIELYGANHGFGNRTRYTPFVFTGPGWIRNSYAGNIEHSFAWCVGGGAMIRLTKWVSFQTIPFEYVLNTSNGRIGNNFDARAGFALTIPKKRSSGI
jgi:hypothetical protein